MRAGARGLQSVPILPTHCEGPSLFRTLPLGEGSAKDTAGREARGGHSRKPRRRPRKWEPRGRQGPPRGGQPARARLTRGALAAPGREPREGLLALRTRLKWAPRAGRRGVGPEPPCPARKGGQRGVTGGGAVRGGPREGRGPRGGERPGPRLPAVRLAPLRPGSPPPWRGSPTPLLPGSAALPAPRTPSL